MIIQTRILPPRFPQNIVQRDELIQLLNKNIDKKLLLISSPAGYGKTTLVQDFLNFTNYRYCWLHITSDLNNFFIFISYLIHSIKTIKSEFGEDTLALLHTYLENNKITNPEIQFIQIIGSLINELTANFNDNMFIVLDDLHEICDSDWFESAFSFLMNENPNNIHFIATSRYSATGGIPGFPSFKAKGYILELGANELSFKQNELYKLLDKIYSYKIIDENLINSLNRFGGWITGIHLYLLHKGSTGQSSLQNTEVTGLSEKISFSDELYEYFANEIFKNISTELQNFLVSTSILTNFDVELCNYIIGINNSLDYLNELLNRNIFIVAIENKYGKLIYNYQPLFSSFLNKKANELLGKEQLKQILSKAVEFYIGKNEPLNIIEYSIKCCEWNTAIIQIFNMMSEMIRDAQYEQIWKWLNDINADPTGKIWEGKYRFIKAVVERYYTGNAQSAFNEIVKSVNLITSLPKTETETPEYKDLLGNCELLRIELLLKIGKTDTAIEEINYKIKKFKDLPDFNKKLIEKIDISTDDSETTVNLSFIARYFYLLGYAYQNNSEFTNAEKYLNLSADLAGKLNNTDLLYDSYNILGNVFLKRGDFIKAIHYYERTLLKTRNLFNKFTVLSNLSILYARSYKLNEALKYFKDAETLYKSLQTSASSGLNTAYLMLKYALHFEFMDFETARDIANEIMEISTKINDVQNIYLSLTFMGECYYYMGMIEHAKQYYQLASKYINKDSYTDKIYDDFLSGIINKHYFGRNELTEDSDNENKNTEDGFLNAYAFYDSEESYYDKSITSYHTADLYLKSGKIDSALHYIKTTFNICSQKDNISFLIREYLLDKSLFDLAIENKIDITFIKQITSLVHDSYEPFTHETFAAKENIPLLSDNARTRIQRLVLDSYDMVIRLFGEPELTVRGQKVTDDRWSRKKRKLIFLYIALNRDKTINKDKLIDIFFTDTPIESIDNQFHQAVSNIRAALRPVPKNFGDKTGSLKKKAKAYSIKPFPEFILYEDKIIKLNPSYRYFIDVEEFVKCYNKHFSSESNVDLKISSAKSAIALYKGDFMSGYYESWCEDLRTDYYNKIIKLLTNAYLVSKDYNAEEAVNFLRKLLTIDKLNEDALFNLVSLLCKLNRQEEANSVFTKYKQNYKIEMDAQLPDKLILNINNILNINQINR